MTNVTELIAILHDIADGKKNSDGDRWNLDFCREAAKVMYEMRVLIMDIESSNKVIQRNSTTIKELCAEDRERLGI